MDMKTFDADNHKELFYKCVLNQTDLMEVHFLDEVGTADYQAGIYHYYKAMRIINIELELNNIKPLPYVFFHKKMTSC